MGRPSREGREYTRGARVPTRGRRRFGNRRRRADARSALAREVRLVARWLDEAFRVPGTDVRIGLDPIVGLFPGVGDLASTVAAAYVLVAAWRLGAPCSWRGWA